MNPTGFDTVVVGSLSWLITYLIHSTILILGVWLLVRGIGPIARRVGPRGENLAWKFALVGALVSTTVQVGAGIRPGLGALELPGASSTSAEPGAMTQRLHPIGRVRADVREGLELIVVRPLAAPAAPLTPPVWPRVVFALALFGSLLGLARLAARLRRIRVGLRERSAVLDDPALEEFLTLTRTGPDRAIRLTHDARLDGPIALGRSEIVIPTRALEQLTPATLRCVLAHELAHLERRDPAWLLLAALIESVCFFQPLIRVARRGMQESAELLCDDWAIARTGDGMVFAKSLAELAGWERRPSALLAGMVSAERPLVRRVRRALDGDPSRGRDEGPSPTRLLLALGSLGLLILLAPGAVAAAKPQSAEPLPTEAAVRAGMVRPEPVRVAVLAAPPVEPPRRASKLRRVGRVIEAFSDRRVLDDLATDGERSKVPGVFDRRELAATADKLEALGEAIERKVERKLGIPSWL